MAFFKKKPNKTRETGQEDGALPVHIAIIPDGNRRWARKRNLPVVNGHREGAERFRKTVIACGELGIRYVTFYAFSTENWKRDPEEVDALMQMLITFLRNFEKELGENKDKIRIRVIGSRNGLSAELLREIARVEEATAANTQIIVNIAINYGSREEIVSCVRSLAAESAAGTVLPESIDEKTVSERLYTAGVPDPDLLIRTSGELRVSNFLLWQLAYTEFYFADVFWPDFDRHELEKALRAFQGRKRRYGAS